MHTLTLKIKNTLGALILQQVLVTEYDKYISELTGVIKIKIEYKAHGATTYRRAGDISSSLQEDLQIPREISGHDDADGLTKLFHNAKITDKPKKRYIKGNTIVIVLLIYSEHIH